MKHPYDLSELLEPQASLTVHLLDFISRLQDRYHALFLEPEPGIYLLNGTSPILKTQPYYTVTGYAEQTPLTQLDGIRESILDSNGQVVIPQYIMQNKQKFLSSIPKVPVRAIQTACLLVKIQIQELVKHDWSPSHRHTLLAPFKPECRDDVDYDEIVELCRDLMAVVDDFIGDKLWHVYFVNTVDTDLTVDRAEDFRIIDWTRMKQQELELDSEQRQASKYCIGDDYAPDLLDPVSFNHAYKASRIKTYPAR
jgi:hypothetical protein